MTMTDLGSVIASYSLPMLSASLVGLCGIFPLLIIPTEITEHLQSEAGSRKLNRLLSFAIGSMLGDVFLHLLPEAYQSFYASVSGNTDLNYLRANSIGLWVIIGVLCFLAIEKLLVQPDTNDKSGSDGVNGDELGSNATSTVQAEGYLNLFANFIDNLTHGLAVGGSYMAGVKVGLITTFCILVHEIPHEISDFAILLRAGFHKWRAAKAQLITASGSVLGAAAAFTTRSSGGSSVSSSNSSSSSGGFGSNILQLIGLAANDYNTNNNISYDNSHHAGSIDTVLAFTSGGFLYLALASLAPQIVNELDAKESLIQVVCLLCGFLSLYTVSLYL